jgi:nucleoside-diphosphate-sugar epimerase
MAGRNGKAAEVRIVVTGAGGRVGRHVVADLVANGHEVHCVDRGRRPTGGLTDGAASWTVHDVRDLDAMTALLDRLHTDAVIHLAAIPSPRFGTPLAGVSRVALASSTSVTGLPFASPPVSPLYVPVDEAHPNVGRDPYALSKEADEATARTMHRRHGYQVVALRICNTSPMAYHVAAAADVARDPAVLACELWAYLDVRDGARAFRLAVERDIPGCHVINVTAADTYSATPTAELLARYHPTTELHRPILGREVPFDLTRSRDLLEFTAEHLLPR